MYRNVKKAGSYRGESKKKSESFSFLVFRVHNKGQTPTPLAETNKMTCVLKTMYMFEFEIFTRKVQKNVSKTIYQKSNKSRN